MQLLKDKNSKILISAFLLCSVLILNILPVSAEEWGPRIAVHYQGDFEKRGVFQSKIFYDHYYIKLISFIEFIEIGKIYEPILRKMQFTIDNADIKISADNPFVMIKSELYQLPLETVFSENEIYVPIKYFADILNKYLPGKYTFDESELVFTILPGSANINGIEIDEKINGTLIRIKATKVFGREMSKWVNQNTGYFYMQIYGGIIDSLRLATAPTKGLIRSIIPVQLPESAQIMFRLRRTLTDNDINVMQDPETHDIIITIANPRKKEQIISDLEKLKDKWKVDTIVIDAGHGGRDPGCIGYKGFKEKDVTLAIALQLGAILTEQYGINVVYTRTTDVFIPLWKRTEIANENEGKLFVSIHANSSRNGRVNGFETYFLSASRSEDAREVMERENSVIELEDTQDQYKDFNNENLMLISLFQSGFMKESEQLAIMMTEGYNKEINRGNRGVKQAGFYVLLKAQMPNALVEVGFLSNKREAQRLISKSYQKKLAESLSEGIMKFIKNIRS